MADASKCIQGVAPCTGLVTGEACPVDKQVSTLIQNITPNLYPEYDATQFKIYWSGGQGTVRFILMDFFGRGINDFALVAHDSAQPLFMGQNLELLGRYPLYYRCEEGDQCSPWGFIHYYFLADQLYIVTDDDLVTPMVDGLNENIIIDGAI